MAVELQGQAALVKVNVDDEGELAMQFDVINIPTLLLFKDNELVDKIIGLKSKARLKNKIFALAGEQS
ncbi:thioredoxin family protein [Paenibacillus sp. 1_12]|uniref:thioredoxin family protein n=1 Tax=Paenibacillus sp. 1_12 TaxID=1566278 RepID=UPI003528A5FA